MDAIINWSKGQSDKRKKEKKKIRKKDKRAE